MTVRATVLVPTFDHGALIRYALASALAQSVRELEVLVVGDGAPQVTRELVAELAERDDRLRFLDNPKGPRNGEAYRHAALAEARGEIVLYLSDDDLWLPDHVETMARRLAGADFASALPLRIEPDGALGVWAGDLGRPFFRELVVGGENWIPLSCGAHTVDAYRRLPEGWRAAPAGTPSDLYMWQKLLRLPGCVAVSETRPTVLHFAGSKRSGWSPERREDELRTWVGRVADAGGRERLLIETLDYLARDRARLDELGRRHRSSFAAYRDASTARRREVEATLTWRLRALLLRSGLLRSAARARAARAASRGTAPSGRDGT